MNVPFMLPVPPGYPAQSVSDRLADELETQRVGSGLLVRESTRGRWIVFGIVAGAIGGLFLLFRYLAGPADWPGTAVLWGIAAVLNFWIWLAVVPWNVSCLFDSEHNVIDVRRRFLSFTLKRYELPLDRFLVVRGMRYDRKGRPPTDTESMTDPAAGAVGVPIASGGNEARVVHTIAATEGPTGETLHLIACAELDPIERVLKELVQLAPARVRLGGVHETLAVWVDDPPHDLVALYEGSYRAEDPSLSIKVLGLPEALIYTQGLREHALLGEQMGLVALHDANDSNPHCYITRGPARGAILHLNHDGDSRIEYPNLASFLADVEECLARRIDFEDRADKETFLLQDQDLLSAHVHQLIADDSEAAEVELVLLTPLVDTRRTDMVEKLAAHPSFFAREAAALLIADRPTAALQGVAEALSKDAHPQVARPGQKAVAAVRRLTV